MSGFSPLFKKCTRADHNPFECVSLKSSSRKVLAHFPNISNRSLPVSAEAVVSNVENLVQIWMSHRANAMFDESERTRKV
jgi:hypothetical protein